MKTGFSAQRKKTTDSPIANNSWMGRSLPSLLVLGLMLPAVPALAQVIIINTNTGAVSSGAAGTVDRRFQQIKPTHVDLPKNELDPKTRYELLRFLEADQGFAMRPLPRGHKGLTLAANGLLEPAGEGYLTMVTDQGLSAKPGDRVVITDIKFDKSKISFMLNGGPDAKHRFLRHIQLGTGTVGTPVVGDDGSEATGSRITLTFQSHVPELDGKQVEALLSPLISFEVKTPIQAFTDTLPPKLKDAILDHHVLVGMSTDMVLFAVGKPVNKIREMDGQMPFEEWIYGTPPQDVQFVRVNGNRVIRVEVAKVGKPPVIFTKDEVEGMMRTDGTPLTTADASPGTRTVEMGDVQRDPDKQAPAMPPSLRQPGDPAPTATTAGAAGSDRVGVMKPVQFPKQAPDDHPVAHQGQQPADGSSGSQTQGQGTPAANGQGNSAPPASSSGSPTPASPGSTPPAQPPPAGTQPD